MHFRSAACPEGESQDTQPAPTPGVPPSTTSGSDINTRTRHIVNGVRDGRFAPWKALEALEKLLRINSGCARAIIALLDDCRERRTEIDVDAVISAFAPHVAGKCNCTPAQPAP